MEANLTISNLLADDGKTKQRFNRRSKNLATTENYQKFYKTTGMFAIQIHIFAIRNVSISHEICTSN